MTPPQATPTAAAATHEIHNAFELGRRKISRHLHRLADEPMDWSHAVDGAYWNSPTPFFSIGNWTSSFPLGVALLAVARGGDPELLDQVLRMEPHYRRKVTEYGEDTMHDLGFLFSLYSVALYQLTGDARHRETGLLAAERLAARAVPPTGYIQAWGRMGEIHEVFQGLAIIDCMMNLPLLHWAAEQTGDRRFRDVALQHAELTRRHFVRPDGSVCHAFRFDPQSGAPLRPDNYCGFAPDSYWARGATWAIYGFALSHRHTGEASHLETALHLAHAFIDRLDAHIVPLWDFRLPEGAPPLRDSSAAAIAACAFDELLHARPQETRLRETRDALVLRLCQPDYLDADESHPGLIRCGQIGGDAIGQARNAYTSWGDYYFMEALARQLGNAPSWW